MGDIEKPGGHDWRSVDALVHKKDKDAVQPIPLDLPLSGMEQRLEVIKNQRLSILGKLKAGKIERRAALGEIQALTEAHLEATKHALKRALDVDKQRVDLIAQKYIYQITEEHLRDMREMGMHNFTARMETLMNLNSETTRLFKQAEDQDVPAVIREKTIEAIMKKYEEFYRKLTAEDMNLP